MSIFPVGTSVSAGFLKMHNPPLEFKMEALGTIMRDILEDLAAASNDLKVFFLTLGFALAYWAILRLSKSHWSAAPLLLFLTAWLCSQFSRDMGEYILPITICLALCGESLSNGLAKLRGAKAWDTAVNAATAAEAAQALAEQAQTSAEAAVPNAQALESFKSDAEKFAGEAEASKVAAVVCEKNSAAAQVAAEASKVDAENALTMAEAAALSAEGFRDQAQSAKADAEAAALGLTSLLAALPKGGTHTQLMAQLLRELVVAASPLAGFTNARALDKIVGAKNLSGFTKSEQYLILAAKAMLTTSLINTATLDTLIGALETQP
jgi:hypothetical protein